MREIKFRIYNPREGKMIESGSTPMMLHSFFKATAPFETRDEMEYQQYTGLKDKNGKEIYEGDIVLWHGGMDEYCTKKAIGKVAWANAGMFIELIKEGEYIYEEREPDAIEFEGPEGPMYWWDGLEIIGNIYENPELLEA